MFRSILSKSLRDYRVPMLAWGFGMLVFMAAFVAIATPAVVTAYISFAGPAAVDWFKPVAGVTRVAQGADEHILQLNVQGDLAQIIQVAGQHGATNIATHEPTLEEAFLRFYEPQQESEALAG